MFSDHTSSTHCYDVTKLTLSSLIDSNNIREFISDRPMCYTSDLNHYFRFNELIEVKSAAETKAFILTANLYHSEFEAFRNTSSRAFIRQPDENSKPYR